MRVHYEFGCRQLNQHGEELCGDSVVFNVQPDFLTLVLADGLGHGVKANILATLTSKIASRMVAEGLPVRVVVETMSETLPVCAVRNLAYSTFTVAKFFPGGRTNVMEFDNPHLFVLRDRRIRPVRYRDRMIQNRRIHDAKLKLGLGDWLVMISDGVINAGIGAASDLGWGWEAIAAYLESHAHPELTAQEVADDLADKVMKLYEGKPGDDVSIAVIKVRRRRFTTILTGPPLRPEDDAAVVARFMAGRGAHACCGGSTANILARTLDRAHEVDLSTGSAEIPPVGRIEGIDLVTEGVLTLAHTLENLKRGVTAKEIQFKVDGASALTRLLLGSDEVTFLVGRALNPAHQNPNLPRDLGLKTHITNEIKLNLEKLGKIVFVEYF
ncbi:MAG: SpoIIE family protein phosphatase [Candidatus Brocadiia bacterium]